MKNYAYNVNTYGENVEATFRTNDVRDALDTFLKGGAQGIHCDLVNGYTGEVLAIINCPGCEDYATDETMLMIKGMIFEAWEGEEIAPEAEEDEPACHYCDGPVNVNGVCQHCGVEDNTLRADPEEIEPDDLFAFLEQMVAEGKAVKLGGMPS
jgi:hypothetical protein